MTTDPEETMEILLWPPELTETASFYTRKLYIPFKEIPFSLRIRL